MDTIKAYYQLVKPGIVYGNAVAAIGGFFLAARGNVSAVPFLGMLFGIMLVIASGCVFNNYMDRGIDKKMARTKNRALVKGDISGPNALVYATVLGLLGLALLFFVNNPLAAAIALFGHFAYVVFYGYMKRKTVHGTVAGSVSGAVPPVVGYVAVTNSLDIGALLLFLVLVCWQMPHFYAVSMFRAKDYVAAGIPVLSVVKGMRAAKLYILSYTIPFTIAALLLTVFGYTGITYFAVMALFGLWWFGTGIRSFHTAKDSAWAGKMFGISLYGLIIFSVMISIDWLLP